MYAKSSPECFCSTGSPCSLFDSSKSLVLIGITPFLSQESAITVKGLSWEYDIFSRMCDCSRVMSGGWYFRFRFGFGTVFSFR